nr:pachytene checkpoint protein 2 homolog isoform X2 [Onthophagus taurus]
MITLNIEVALKSCSTITEAQIITTCFSYLITQKFKSGMVISKFSDRVLNQEVDYILIEDTDSEDYINLTEVRINWYVYTLHNTEPQMDSVCNSDDETINLATHLTLPSTDLLNLWDNLIYDSQIKDMLLKYAATIMEFSKKGVDTNIVTCNRVILLHGPPGTGKTSLCKALAQKLSIRMRYKHNVLIEVNSHSLFSKWFSESGKLVTKMFTRIKEVVEDNKTLVCVLFDEIESLAHAREQCMSGNEPSDSIRVVNAILTQIDQIRRYPNVVVLATSNITGAIDIAFIDRADIKQYLGLPSPQAIYQIYYSCLQELFMIFQTYLSINNASDMIKLLNRMNFIH